MDARRSLLGPMVLVLVALLTTPASAVTCRPTWAVQALPTTAGLPAIAYAAMAVSDTGDLWLAGTERDSNGTPRGVIAHRRDGRWQVTTLQRPSLVLDIATSRGSVWAVGQRGDGGPPLVMTLRAGRWTEVRTPSASAALSGVRLSAADDVWLTGAESSSSGSRVLAMHFDGRSWRQFDLARGRGLGLATNGPSDTWVVGRRESGPLSDSQGVPTSWHWNGRSWQQEVLWGFPAARSALLLKVRSLQNGSVWAVGIWPLGNCCNNVPIVAQHVAGGWRDRTGSLDQADGLLSGILDGRSSGEPTVVGTSFVGDSGGGWDTALLAERAGTRWTHPRVAGLGQPQQVRNAYLSAADGRPGVGNFAVGGWNGKPLLLHQCRA